ncbi:hypothetical protein BASA81_002944 [Batrachochytrium salamandrivorans]|nr:hypothetical protein BASA81_002944 [Batrachochytrium salamandrivorans]
MSFLTGYASSSSDEEEETRGETVAPQSVKPRVLPASSTSKPSSSKLFAPLPQPQRKQVNLRNLPLLFDKEEDEISLSSSDSELEEGSQVVAPPAPAIQATYKAFAAPVMTSSSSSGRRRMADDENDEEDAIAPTITAASQVELTRTAAAAAAVLEEEEEAPRSKRQRQTEELILERLGEGGSTADLAFAAEISTSEIRREAALLQQREGGLLAANLAKTQGITGRRNHQLSHMAQVAMKQKQDKDV